MPRLPLIFAIALVSAAPVGLASAQAAQTADAKATLSVRGVDFADRAQVKAFYDRVKMTARVLCNGDTLTPWGLRDDQECRARFINDAVRQVNAPLLTAMSSPDSRKSSAFASDDY